MHRKPTKIAMETARLLNDRMDFLLLIFITPRYNIYSKKKYFKKHHTNILHFVLAAVALPLTSVIKEKCRECFPNRSYSEKRSLPWEEAGANFTNGMIHIL